MVSPVVGCSVVKVVVSPIDVMLDYATPWLVMLEHAFGYSDFRCWLLKYGLGGQCNERAQNTETHT